MISHEAANDYARLVFRTAFELHDAAILEPDARKRADGLRRAVRLLDDARWLSEYPHDGDADAVMAWLEPRVRRTNVAASASLLTKQRDELLSELFAIELGKTG